MPVFFQHDIDRNTKLAVWEIAEDDDFFLRRVMLQSDVTHPHKRLQHLAGRYLLPHLFPQFPVDLIRIADTRKPYLEGEPFHFSISHSGNYAAAIVSSTTRVGIDVELFTPKIQRIAHKFVSESERELLPLVSIPFHILVWSCKEAVFKWYGLGGMDFLEHMQIRRLRPVGHNHFQVEMLFSREQPNTVCLETRFFDDLCLSWIVSDL